MTIKEVTGDYILFDNGKKITYDHERDCCETNYAYFEQIDDLARGWEFSEPLEFEFVKNSGFRFGNGNRMVFVPCYSLQNGYYTTNIDIYYNSKIVCNGYCEKCYM